MKNRVRFFSLAASLLMAAPAMAQSSAPSAVDRMNACRGIADNEARLACFDAALQPPAETAQAQAPEARVEMEEQQASSFGLSTPKPDAAPEAKPQQTAEEFGAEVLPQEREKKKSERLSEITSGVAAIDVVRYDKLVITLDNGQVWRQLNSDSETVLVPGDPQQYSVKIKRSFMGSYRMTIKELRRTIRVTRVE